MGLPVILTPQAKAKGTATADCVHQSSGFRFQVSGFSSAALAIDPFPERGRMVPEARDPAVREVLHGDYRIIYEVQRDPDAIYVLRFWHGARGTPHLPRA